MVEAVDLDVIDQQPAHVTPEKVYQRAMGIRLFVGVLVMQAVDGDPLGRRVLHAKHAEHGKRVFQPLRHDEALVREQSVVAEIDAERTEEVHPQNRQRHAGPTEEVRKKGEACDRVVHDERNRVVPHNDFVAHGRRTGQTAVLVEPSVPFFHGMVGGDAPRRHVRRGRFRRIQLRQDHLFGLFTHPGSRSWRASYGRNTSWPGWGRERPRTRVAVDVRSRKCSAGAISVDRRRLCSEFPS